MQLLTAAQQKQNLYWKHSVEGLLRANSKERAEYHKILISTGVETPNEAREYEEKNPSKDPLADVLWMPTGLIPISKFDDYLAKNTGRDAGRPSGQDSPPEPEEAPAIEDKTKEPLKLLEGRN